jgi:uncharacterized protein YjiS (DUF1127 family)
LYEKGSFVVNVETAYLSSIERRRRAMLKALHFSTPTVDLASVPARIAHIVLEWQARAEQRQNLANLDDDMLKDLGLTRAQVAEEVNKPFWQA